MVLETVDLSGKQFQQTLDVKFTDKADVEKHEHDDAGSSKAVRKHHCHHHHHHNDTESSWKHYVDHTSLHGVFQIQNSDTKWGRFAWMAIFVAALAGLTFMVSTYRAGSIDKGRFSLLLFILKPCCKKMITIN